MVGGSFVFLSALHFGLDLCYFLGCSHCKVEILMINIIKISILFGCFTAKGLQKTSRRLLLSFKPFRFFLFLLATDSFIKFNYLHLLFNVFIFPFASTFISFELIFSHLGAIKHFKWILSELVCYILVCFFLTMLKDIFLLLFKLTDFASIVGSKFLGQGCIILFLAANNIIERFYNSRKGVYLITNGELEPFFNFTFKLFDFLLILSLYLTLSLRNIAIVPSTTVEERKLLRGVMLEAGKISLAVEFELLHLITYISSSHKTNMNISQQWLAIRDRLQIIKFFSQYFDDIMQNTPYYISKDFIAKIPEEQIIENYPDVEVYIEQMKIVGMKLQITTHRLILTSNTNHSLLVKGQSINEAGISQSGFFSKDYFVKLHTQFGKLKLALKSFNEAKINIDNMIKKKAWLIKPVQKKPESQMYSGLFDKINKEKEKISTQNEQVSQSFATFDSLFGNLREIKKIMNDMKTSSGQNDGDNPQVNKILKDMGFVSVIQKDQTGKNFYKQLASNLYQVCANSLFKNYGGVVSLVDLYYFYNKKRQLNLLSPEQILKACQMFPALGLHAKLVRYPNNVILVESTTFDADADFKQNYAKYFANFSEGYTAEQIARRKGLPVAIAEIKLKQACKKGFLAYSDRIQGIKYFKNLLATI